ncbi:hypothetical protein TREES_T100009625 [Tupaia chinensis]|uniref:Uncharacterized protein n=1 Tax=Tupaia chinensis TaxID=246437 RepID=L9LC75_TUPCH|nr:hypothetical protein TREES_T100009625 [Tupaia chinensis]
MAHTSSISDDIDMDDCSSKSGSNLSLSVGYFPCEDIYCDEDKTSCEDISSNSSSIHFLPPIQGTWRTENIRRPIGRRDQIPDNPEQFCKLSIALAWDVDVDSNNANSIDNWDLNGSSHWIDKYPEEKTELTVSKLDDLVQKLETFLENQKDDKDDESVFPQSTEEEDHQPPGSSPQDTAQVSHQEHIYQDPPKFEPADNEDITKSPQIPSRLKGHEFAEVRKYYWETWVSGSASGSTQTTPCMPSPGGVLHMVLRQFGAPGVKPCPPSPPPTTTRTPQKCPIPLGNKTGLPYTMAGIRAGTELRADITPSPSEHPRGSYSGLLFMVLGSSQDAALAVLKDQFQANMMLEAALGPLVEAVTVGILAVLTQTERPLNLELLEETVQAMEVERN